MLSEFLACPVCHTALEGARCPGCGREFAGGDYTPRPLPDPELERQWALWEQLQANGAEVYAGDPAHNLSVGEREDTQAFKAFAQLTGSVLDVGCGPQELPSYAGGEEFVGLDPLRGGDRQFAFVRGVAEFLPFRDGVFDRVLFATSLDHILGPRRALAEARRVLAPGGQVCIWHGEPPPPARRSWRQRLRGRPKLLGYSTPRGAADPFHVAHPRLAQVHEWVAAEQLSVTREERDEVGNCLLAATA